MVRVFRVVSEVLIQASMEKSMFAPKFSDALLGTEMPLSPLTLMA